jgi:hypothetical protein
MPDNLDRRKFLRKSTIVSATVMAAGPGFKESGLLEKMRKEELGTGNLRRKI